MANEQVPQVAPATVPTPQVPPAVQAATPVTQASAVQTPVAPAPAAPLSESDLRLVVRSLDQWFIADSKSKTIAKRTYRPEHKDMSPAELVAAIMPGVKTTQMTVREDGVISFFITK